MLYRAVGNRCAVQFRDLNLPIGDEEAMEILKNLGFQRLEVEIVKLARAQVGVASYRRGARLAEAPKTFDCSSLMKWLYGEKGIWLPRRSIQQRELGETIGLDNIQAGDLIFVSGRINYYLDDPRDGVGHVGIATGQGTVIHAANSRVGVIESLLDQFVQEDGLRGIRRIVSNDHQVYTFVTPADREVEWSDDIRWIIVQNLPSI